jgi:hypothetical protein
LVGLVRCLYIKLLDAAPQAADAKRVPAVKPSRIAFEHHWVKTRGGKKARNELQRHPEQPQTYVADSANRHWVTWQAAIASAAPQAAQPTPAQEPFDDATLYRAAINCKHEIDREQITLFFDPKQPGANALNQLQRRLNAAIPQPTPAQPPRVTQAEVDACKSIVDQLDEQTKRTRELDAKYPPEIDCRQCAVYSGKVVPLYCEGVCTNGDKFVKLPVLQLWRKG